MRMALGLVSLLVVLGIIMLLFSIYEAPMLKRGASARQQAQQIAGRDEDNAPVTDAMVLEAQDHNGRMEGAVVKSVVAGSAIETHYGFQAGDVILQLGELTVRDSMNSPGEVKDFLLKAYQENRPVVVMRGFERVTLPLEVPARNAAASAAPPTQQAPGLSPAEPEKAAQAKPAPKKPGGLEGQLDLIRKLGEPQNPEPQ